MRRVTLRVPEQLVKEHYGEVVEEQEGDDWIDLQECHVIT